MSHLSSGIFYKEPLLRAGLPKSLHHLFGVYSLIPIFLPELHENDQYELYCRLPTQSLLLHGTFVQIAQLHEGDSENTFRIFDCRRPYFHLDEGGLVSFSNVKPLDPKLPTNYWKLPEVPCAVILYLFLVGAKKLEKPTEFTWPEIILAKDIYQRLQRVARFSTTRPPLLKTLSTPPSSVKRATCGRHPSRGFTKHYCQACYTLVPSPRSISQPDFGAKEGRGIQSISVTKRSYSDIEDSDSDPDPDDGQVSSSDGEENPFQVSPRVADLEGKAPGIVHAASY
ncbi:hypothetical protein K438DRAFT_1804975 [Mycena galopus ATCC 62051]|nr:hypothetical protein K438DRAFT_1804975 [Mycena galopus ATCC 62051]